MKRRDFIGKTGCGFAGLVAAPVMLSPSILEGQENNRRYKIEIEIYEAREDTWCHHKGDRFVYPDEWGKICPWLRGSLNDFVRALELGVTLGWKYPAPYEKVIDPDGITTEFVRCPDPTADLVAKIIRTKVG